VPDEGSTTAHTSSTQTISNKSPGEGTTTALASSTQTISTKSPGGGYFLLLDNKTPEVYPSSSTSPSYPNFRTWQNSNSAAIYKNQIVTCGGQYLEQNCTSIQVGGGSSWNYSFPPMQDVRWSFNMITVGDKMLAVGGREKAIRGEDQNTVMEFDGESWTMANWTLEKPVSRQCSVVVSSTQFVVIGGFGVGWGLDSVTEYNIVTGEWKPLTPLPLKLYDVGCCMYNGQITVSGGSGRGQRFSKKTFTLKDNQWNELGELNKGRNAHYMGVLEGELYALGGRGEEIYGAGSASFSVEKYSASEGRWINQPNLSERFELSGAVTVN